MAYWNCVFTERTWEEFLAAGGDVMGFPANNFTLLKQVQPGDSLLAYLPRRGWIAEFGVASPAFFDDSPIWVDQIYPARVRVRAVAAPGPDAAVPAARAYELPEVRRLPDPGKWGVLVRTLKRWDNDSGALLAQWIGGAVTGAGEWRSEGSSPTAPATAAVAITDTDWLQALRNSGPHEEVNFWRPSPRGVPGLASHARVYFLLHAPDRRIAGYGTFDRFEARSIHDAWRLFGPANGVDSEEALTARLSGIRRRLRANDVEEIGCLVLNDPVFFADDEYFDPADVGEKIPNEVVSMKYFERDPFSGRAVLLSPPAAGDYQLFETSDAALTTATKMARPGQGRLRASVLLAYGGACCVTGETSAEVVEAAHIQPYGGPQSDHIQNVLPLRVDLHRLFDANLLAIEDDYTIRVSPFVTSPYYQAFNGKTIRVPDAAHERPSKSALLLRSGQLRQPISEG